MPNLNQLAAESVVFDQAYVTQPVCTPSRSTLHTGLYPHANGCIENNIPLRPDTFCLPEMIAERRYYTGHFGKWHLGDELYAQHGFDEWISIEDAYNHWFTAGRDRNVRSDYHHFLLTSGFKPKNGILFTRDEAARLPEKFGKPAFLARAASRFLSERRDQPFALYVNFLEPHMPFCGPRDSQYDPSAMPLPENFEDVFKESAPLKHRLMREKYTKHNPFDIDGLSREGWQELIARYWGLCSLVDTHVGTILEALRQSGQWDNTIVVFTSDHGDMMGAHGLAAKCVMFQEAVRVPMMIKMPGQRRSCRVMGPVSQVDIVPTLLDLMEYPIPGYLQGKSLRRWMEQPDIKHDEPVFMEWNGRDGDVARLVRGELQMPEWTRAIADSDQIQSALSDSVRSVITVDGWKLNCSQSGEHELYNLVDDPNETRNIFEQNKNIAMKLQREIRLWQARVGDYTELPDFT